MRRTSSPRDQESRWTANRGRIVNSVNTVKPASTTGSKSSTNCYIYLIFFVMVRAFTIEIARDDSTNISSLGGKNGIFC